MRWILPGPALPRARRELSPASGAKFSLLPPDNATGNFTKVVQRIPVRIRLDDPQDPTICCGPDERPGDHRHEVGETWRRSTSGLPRRAPPRGGSVRASIPDRDHGDAGGVMELLDTSIVNVAIRT